MNIGDSLVFATIGVLLGGALHLYRYYYVQRQRYLNTIEELHKENLELAQLIDAMIKRKFDNK